MLRALSLIACVVLLAGCVSTPSYRYYGERSYSDGYRSQVVVVEQDRYVGSAWSAPVWYDYPVYYSMFWSLNRAYVDPYWYPSFYYGVTWFPRNYYSSIYRSWHGPSVYLGWSGRPWHGYLSYSPYRYAWIDNYYDWYPWYSAYPRYTHYYPPRYGNTRNEAERLSRYSDAFRGGGLPANELNRLSAFSRAARSQARVDAQREAWRGADYGSRGDLGRRDPGVSGFRQAESNRLPSDARRQPASSRQDPGVSGFRGPDYGDGQRPLPERSAPTQPRRLDDQGVAYPYRERPSAIRPPVERRAVNSGDASSTAPRITTRRSAEFESAPRHSSERPVVEPRRSGESYAPRVSGEPYESRSRYESTAPRQTAPVRAAPRYEAPAREASRYQAPRPEPRYEAPRTESRYQTQRPEPRYQAPRADTPRAEPRYQAPRSEPRYEAPRSESRSEAPARERPQPMTRGEPRDDVRSRDED